MNSEVAGRQQDFFHVDIETTNDNGPVWQLTTVEATGSQNMEGNVYVPPATLSPVYDTDGNLENDGRWVYKWNGENRLIEMTTTPEAQAVNVPYRRLVFTYDGQGRRIRKEVYDGTSLLEDRRWAYDGWNPIVEYLASGATLSIARTYLWGTDLSGSEQGAGGVGGLLSVKEGASEYLPSYDGNGNITGWVDLNGALVAEQDYDPFGNRIVFEGSVDLPWGFSTKYEDKETGLCYYGFRYYDPVKGRWASRDPITERGGVNLYGFVGNNGIGRWDYLGLITVKPSYDGVYPGKCGSFEIQWELGVEKQPVGETGWIISNVEFNWDVKNCKGEEVQAPLRMQRGFYEAFGPFRNGGSFGKIVDTWKSSDRHPCTTGSVTITGDMRYYNEARTGVLIPPHPDWTYSGPTTPSNQTGPPYRPPSHTAPSTWTEPPYYGNPASSKEPTAKVSATISWDCCPKNSDQRDNSIETNPSMLGGWK